MSDEIARLKNKIAHKNQEITDFQKRVAYLTQLNSELKKDHLTAKNVLRELVLENQSLQQERDRVQAEYFELKKALDDVARMLDRFEGLERELMQKDVKLDAAVTIIQTSESKLIELQKDADDYKKQNEELVNMCNQLLLELETAKTPSQREGQVRRLSQQLRRYSSVGELDDLPDIPESPADSGDTSTGGKPPLETRVTKREKQEILDELGKGGNQRTHKRKESEVQLLGKVLKNTSSRLELLVNNSNTKRNAQKHRRQKRLPGQDSSWERKIGLIE